MNHFLVRIQPIEQTATDKPNFLKTGTFWKIDKYYIYIYIYIYQLISPLRASVLSCFLVFTTMVSYVSLLTNIFRKVFLFFTSSILIPLSSSSLHNNYKHSHLHRLPSSTVCVNRLPRLEPVAEL
ncbi:hypothetical protein HanIR_Chr17g0903291 [Helianthus annuus]|nr:hypothetical protein HanIR_Chr17g0903291 [Helianthus annuus]